jgi:hypothetical protein
VKYRPPPARHWRSYGDDTLPTGAEALGEPFTAVCFHRVRDIARALAVSASSRANFPCSRNAALLSRAASAEMRKSAAWFRSTIETPRSSAGVAIGHHGAPSRGGASRGSIKTPREGLCFVGSQCRFAGRAVARTGAPGHDRMTVRPVPWLLVALATLATI